jgi:hypothetical protein
MNAGRALVFLAEFLDKATGDQVLELLISTEAKHFLAAAHGIAYFEICKNSFKQVVETKNFLFRKHTAKFISDMIRKAT